jgi:hypothetical protein
MTRAALFANLLTAVALPTPTAAAPAPPAAVAEPREAGLGALQLAAGYAVGVGGTLWLIDAGIHPEGDAAFVYLAALAPTLTGAAVCGTGYLSPRYRARCSRTVLGAFGGAAVGMLVGALFQSAIASALGVDSDPDVPTDTLSMVMGAAVFMPIGAVTAWHLDKREIAAPPTVMAPPPRNPMLPLVSLRW